MKTARLDRVYWYLVLFGPSTMEALCAYFNWTCARMNNALYDLRRTGCVRLIERHQHRNARGMTCGKWIAITEAPVSQTPIVDAISEKAIT